MAIPILRSIKVRRRLSVPECPTPSSRRKLPAVEAWQTCNAHHPSTPTVHCLLTAERTCRPSRSRLFLKDLTIKLCRRFTPTTPVCSCRGTVPSLSTPRLNPLRVWSRPVACMEERRPPVTLLLQGDSSLLYCLRQAHPSFACSTSFDPRPVDRLVMMQVTNRADRTSTPRCWTRSQAKLLSTELLSGCRPTRT